MFNLFRLFLAVPVTWMMLFFSGLLYAADLGLSHRLGIGFNQAQEILGAESNFRLWDGGWWTIVTTAFHHGGAVHLLLNTTCLWYLGRLLETRMGSWRYAVFCLFGILVSGCVQSIWGPYVGISGMLCAQLGLIWAWRNTDTWLQTYFPKEQLHTSLLSLFICLPLDWLGIVRIANAAHFSGLFYGYIAGQVFFGSVRVRLWKPLFLAAHACLIPTVFFLAHPVWSGLYHWHLGDRANDPRIRRIHFQNAVYWEPNLDGPWLNLAIISANEGKLQEAWDYLLRCLQYHPSYRPAINFARELWTRFPNAEERDAARFRLRQVFGQAAATWEERLLAQVRANDLIPLKRIMDVLNRIPTDKPEQSEATEPPITLPSRTLEDIRKRDQKLPSPDPNSPGSAEEGTAA